MQAMALPVVLSTNRHVVVGARTGAGKTLVGSAAVLRAILLEDRKAVWLTPARSLAAELDARFKRWQARGIRVVRLTGEERTATPELRSAQLWVATTEKFESVCRGTSVGSLVDDVGCIVVDEIHLVGSTTRGPVLEGLLARLRSAAQQTRLIGLSGTVSNLDLLSTWLRAQRLESVFEPVPVLKQLVTYEPGTTSMFANRSKDLAVRTLVAEARAAGEPVLVFCDSGAGAMRTAAFLAGIPYGEHWADLAASCRAHGVGVSFRAAPEASAAEAAFRAGSLRILVATTAVATGVNLPAKVVVIRDDRLGLDPLTTDVALQLLGPAGRYGQAEFGRGYLLVPTPAYGAWRQRLRAGHVVHSRILDQVEGAVLAEVLRGAITTIAEAREWFAGTLAHAEGQAGYEPIDKALDLLLDNGFLTRQAERLAVTPLGRLTSQFLIDPVVAAEVLTTLGDLRIPSHPDDAESRLLATLASGVPDLSDTRKTLLAATVALDRPAQLATPGDVEGVPVGELRESADQLARYLGWLGALQLHSALDWLVPVAADLAQRLQYRRARPSRGSGRMLRLLAATSRSGAPERSTADALLRLLAAGIHRPEQVDPDQLHPRLQRLRQDWPSFLCHRLALELDRLDVERDSLVLSLDGVADNLSIRLRVSAGELSAQVQLDSWSGRHLTIEAPSGVEHGQVAVELLAHNRYDWCYRSRRFSIDANRLYRAVDERARQLIGELPRQPPPGQRNWRPRLSGSQRQRHHLQAIFESDPDVLGPLATHLAGDDAIERRSNRLVAAVNRLLVIRPDVIGDPSMLRHPASVLLAGSASPLERSLVIAMLLRALGYRVGLLIIEHRPSSVVPMVFTSQGWQTVEPPPRGRGSLLPLIPRRLDDGAPSVLQQPGTAQEPQTAWDLLASYQAVAPLPSQD
jgi:helicase